MPQSISALPMLRTTIPPHSPQSAIVALLLLIPVPSVAVYIAVASQHEEGVTFGWAAYALSKAWVLILPLIWHVYVDRGRLSLSPARLGGFRTGIILGLLMMLAIIIAYLCVRDFIDIDRMRLVNARNGLSTPARFFMLVVPLTLVNSLLEEYVWRWFVFRKCEALFGGLPAAIVAGILFTGHHIVALKAQTSWPLTILGTVGVAIAASLWSWCYAKYRSIWPGYVSHILADVGVYIVGYLVLFA